jgi:hypothetical protein
MSPVDRRVEYRPNGHDSAVVRAHVHLAADAAVRARRPCPPGRGARSCSAGVVERPGRTRIHAGAAAHAGAPEQVRTVRHDARAGAARADVPDPLPLHVGADAHAAVAVDAARHVHGDVGVRSVLELDVDRAALFAVESRGLQRAFELEVLGSGRRRRAPPGEQLEQRSAIGLELRRAGLDNHPVLDRRRARGNETAVSLDLHQARPAHPCRPQPIVVTERGHVLAEPPNRRENGRARLACAWPAIDHRVDHDVH